MLPSRDDIAKFIAIAPEANEGTALRFLEVTLEALAHFSFELY